MVRRTDEDKRLATIFEWLDGGDLKTIAGNNGIGPTTAWDMVKKAKKSCPSLEDLRSINITIRERAISAETALASASYVARAMRSNIRPDALPEYIEFLESLSGDKDPLFEAAKDLVELKKASGKSYDQLASDYRQLDKEVKDLRAIAENLIPLRQEYDEISDGLVKGKYALKICEAERSKKQAEVDILSSVIEQLNGMKTSTEKQISENKKRFEEISSQIKAKEVALEATEDEIRKKKEAFSAEVAKHKTWIAEKNRSKKQLEKTIQAKQSEIEAADKKMQEIDNKLKDLSESIGKKKPLIPLISLLESPNAVLDKTALLEALLTLSEGLRMHAPTYSSQYHSNAIESVSKTLYYDRRMLMEELKRDRPGPH